MKKPYQKAVQLAKKIAKERDGYKCIRCGRSKKNGYQIHGSHILGVGAYPKLAVYPINIKALCFRCHRWWHSAPTESGEWFKKTFPDWWRELDEFRKQKEGELQKSDYKLIYEELKKDYKSKLKKYE